MKLISEEKRELFRDKKYNEYPISPNGLKYGDSCIDFAENELQNLAIEFAKWLSDNYDMTENKNEWSDWTETHTTEKCFDLFLELRKKQF